MGGLTGVIIHLISLFIFPRRVILDGFLDHIDGPAEEIGITHVVCMMHRRTLLSTGDDRRWLFIDRTDGDLPRQTLELLPIDQTFCRANDRKSWVTPIKPFEGSAKNIKNFKKVSILVKPDFEQQIFFFGWLFVSLIWWMIIIKNRTSNDHLRSTKARIPTAGESRGSKGKSNIRGSEQLKVKYFNIHYSFW